jgi:hypothetical protein
MTPNDVQIDVLMRRYAKHAGGASSPEHLDVDELTAFAEGALPPAARARYVSHLADCDNCRQIVSQLTISAGTTITEPAVATAGERISWSQRLGALFAPRNLRYAAFAAVLIAAAGTAFLVVQRRANNPASDLVAQNQPDSQTGARAVNPEQAAVPQASADNFSKEDTNRNVATRESPQIGKESGERDESKLADSSVPPPKPTAETSFGISPSVAAKKSAEPAKTESQPSYAPAPPGETQGLEARSRQKQSVGGLASGPRKTDSSDDKLKAMDRAAPTVAKDRPADENNRAAVNQAPQSNSRIAQEKRGGPRRSMDNMAQTQRNEQELRAQAPKTGSDTAGAATSEEAPETRSVGGRKFRRQGSAWVDLKFKSSMAVKSIARGSEEFSSLDSGLRSIASQLSGEIIVVWKSKAYRIR